MATNDVKFFVGDQIYTGWKTISIKRSIDALCGAYSFDFHDRWIGDATQWPIIPNRSAKIMIGNELVLTGYIDDLSLDHDATTKTMSASGRDKACDLIDCSAIPREYSNLKADKIAEDLLGPFGLTLIADTDAGEKFAKWTVKPGETAFENLERIGKLRALFFVSDEFGFVRMQKRASTKSAGRLVYGENIKKAGIKYDNINRFSSYLVIGQSAGTNNFNGLQTISAKGQAADSGVNRYRPIILQAEGNANQKSAQLRANWELSVRIANAVRVTVTVYGWTMANGKIWRINELVDLIDPMLGINGEMLISSVNFKKDDSGTVSELELVRKEAFLPEPEVVKTNKASISGYDEDEDE